MTNRREFVLTLAAAAPLKAGENDAKVLRTHLRKSEDAFLASVRGLSEAQWSFKAAPDRWSIAECAEHIAASEDFLRGIVETKVLASPAPVGERVSDEKVLGFIIDRTSKFKAPEPVQPKKSFGTPAETVKHFKESREKTFGVAKRKDLRDHAGDHPAFKQIDAHQWLLFLSGHTLRHTAQIEEVKATAGYPK